MPDVISGRTFSPRVARSHRHMVAYSRRASMGRPVSVCCNGPSSWCRCRGARVDPVRWAARKRFARRREERCLSEEGRASREEGRGIKPVGAIGVPTCIGPCVWFLNIDGWFIRASMVFGLAPRRGVRFAVRPAAANVPHARTCRQVQGGISDKRHVDCKSRPMPQAQRRCPTTRAHKSSNRWPYLSFECVCGFAAKQLFCSSNSRVPTHAPAKTQNHV